MRLYITSEATNYDGGNGHCTGKIDILYCGTSIATAQARMLERFEQKLPEFDIDVPPITSSNWEYEDDDNIARFTLEESYIISGVDHIWWKITEVDLG